MGLAAARPRVPGHQRDQRGLLDAEQRGQPGGGADRVLDQRRVGPHEPGLDAVRQHRSVPVENAAAGGRQLHLGEPVLAQLDQPLRVLRRGAHLEHHQPNADHDEHRERHDRADPQPPGAVGQPRRFRRHRADRPGYPGAAGRAGPRPGPAPRTRFGTRRRRSHTRPGRRDATLAGRPRRCPGAPLRGGPPRLGIDLRAAAARHLPVRRLRRGLLARQTPTRGVAAGGLSAGGLATGGLAARILPARGLSARRLPARGLSARRLPAVRIPVRRLRLGRPAAARRLAAVEHLEGRPERVGGAAGAGRAGALVTFGHGAAARRVRPRVADAAEAALRVGLVLRRKVTRRAAPGRRAPARCVVRTRRHRYRPVPPAGCPAVPAPPLVA